MEYITERAESDQPWYLWLCYSSPHSPQTPARRHQGNLDKVTEIALPASLAMPREGKPNYVRKISVPSTKAIETLARKYHECILSIDENVGRLTDTLRQTGQLDNTVVIFASDQGLGMGHHGHVKRKNAPYDGTLTSPLIFRFPRRFPAGGVCPQPVGGPDVVQTLHELTGVVPLWGCPLSRRGAWIATPAARRRSPRELVLPELGDLAPAPGSNGVCSLEPGA